MGGSGDKKSKKKRKKSNSSEPQPRSRKTCVVEKFTGARKKGNLENGGRGYLYEIKWKNCGEQHNSWEPTTHLVGFEQEIARVNHAHEEEHAKPSANVAKQASKKKKVDETKKRKKELTNLKDKKERIKDEIDDVSGDEDDESKLQELRGEF